MVALGKADAPPAIALPCAQRGLNEVERLKHQFAFEIAERWRDATARKRTADHALVTGGTHGAMINDGLAGNPDRPSRVDHAIPAGITTDGESMWVLGQQNGFGSTITDLLAEVTGNGGSTIVPDECPGGEAQAKTGIAEAPTEINIITGGAEIRIKASNGVKGFFHDGEIAAREMFGFDVIDHDVAWCAQCGGNRGLG